ncbi:hypothetical protein VTL71DRAFT_3490 [Oculimacula yallundae]|uniref:Uncharacterized protein n=1 Tax=Oculimacula yallundae TaxID=86028 RepID=A0ABR4C7B3_9HELO
MGRILMQHCKILRSLDATFVNITDFLFTGVLQRKGSYDCKGQSDSPFVSKDVKLAKNESSVRICLAQIPLISKFSYSSSISVSSCTYHVLKPRRTKAAARAPASVPLPRVAMVWDALLYYVGLDWTVTSPLIIRYTQNAANYLQVCGQTLSMPP